jgi:hypothetical protein
MVPQGVRELIRTMSRENPIGGAPRIHGELLKLGIDIGETSVSKYMIRRRRPPSQTWRTFLENHARSLVSVDFLTVPTIRFQILYVFLVLGTRPPADSPLCRDRSSNSGMDCTATAGSLSMGHRASLFAAGSRSDLWAGLLSSTQGHGDQTGAVRAALAVATCLCGTGDRNYSPRVLGPRHRISTNEAFAGTFEISWTTIIEAGLTWDWRRTRRSLGPSSLPKPGVSFRFRRSADFIIVTRGAPPKSPHFKFSLSPPQQ